VTPPDRRDTLEDLIRLRKPIDDAIQAVRELPWDSEAELVTLTRDEARRLLDSFTSGVVTANACGAWANAIEVRDDIGLEEGAEDVLKDFLFELATPEITRALTRETAEEWRHRLQ
jgi:hypothetical protein